MKRVVMKLLSIGLIFMSTTCSAWAGSQQYMEPNLPIEELIELTKKLEKTMADRGARVFLIARSGMPIEKLPDGLKYTHVAFGVYSKIKTNDDRTIPGYAYYNLYQRQDDPSKSNLVVDYTIDFVNGIYKPEVGIIIPVPELQMRLLSIIGTDDYTSLHNSEYSLLANPNNTKYQNCTEFVLDVINASIYKTVNKEVIKLNNEKYFKRQEINVSPFKLLLSSLFAPDIRTLDHNGKIRIATFTTIVNYLKKYNLVTETMTIGL